MWWLHPLKSDTSSTDRNDLSLVVALASDGSKMGQRIMAVLPLIILDAIAQLRMQPLLKVMG